MASINQVLFTQSVHLDGMREEHDKAVCQDGVFDRCVSAIKKPNP